MPIPSRPNPALVAAVLCAAVVAWVPLAYAGGPPLSDAAVRMLELEFERAAFPADLPADATFEETVRAVLGQDRGPALVVFEECAAPAGAEGTVLAPHPVASLLVARFSLRDFVGIHVCRFINDEGARARLMLPRFFRLVLVDLAGIPPERRAALGATTGAAVAVTDAEGHVRTRRTDVHAGQEWNLIAAMSAALDPALRQRAVEAGDRYLIHVSMAAARIDDEDGRVRMTKLEADLGMRHPARVETPAKEEPKQ